MPSKSKPVPFELFTKAELVDNLRSRKVPKYIALYVDREGNPVTTKLGKVAFYPGDDLKKVQSAVRCHCVLNTHAFYGLHGLKIVSPLIVDEAISLALSALPDGVDTTGIVDAAASISEGKNISINVAPLTKQHGDEILRRRKKS